MQEKGVNLAKQFLGQQQGTKRSSEYFQKEMDEHERLLEASKKARLDTDTRQEAEEAAALKAKKDAEEAEALKEAQRIKKTLDEE